jgi:glycosyltransferase involved in cell wall biosynthesis
MLISAAIIAGGQTDTARAMVERLMPRMIESIEGVVDQVVIIDTGLSPATRSFLSPKQNLAGIDRTFLRIRSPWQDDFSEARNESIEHCEGDWILVIDTDEYLECLDIEALRKYLKDLPSEIDRVWMEVTIQDAKSQYVTSRLNSPRLFRNGTVKYVGAVHNQPARYKPGGDDVTELCRIVTDGYSQSEEEQADKWARHHKMCKEWLKREPEASGAWYALGKQYNRWDQKRESAGKLRRYGFAKAAADFHWRSLNCIKEGQDVWNAGAVFGAIDCYLSYIKRRWGDDATKLTVEQKKEASPYVYRIAELATLATKIMPQNPDIMLALTDYAIWMGDSNMVMDCCIRYLNGYKAMAGSVAARGSADAISLREDLAALQMARLFEVMFTGAMGVWRELLSLLPLLPWQVRNARFGEVDRILKEAGWHAEADRGRMQVFPLDLSGHQPIPKPKFSASLLEGLDGELSLEVGDA